MPVEALDALVYTVLAILWALFSLAVTGGAVLLHRHNTGLHHSAGQAGDTGHQPAHARPVPPRLWAGVVDDALTSVRDLCQARALLTGAPLWS